MLPVYSLGTEEEAQELIVLACPTNGRGEYVAPELAQEQTLENLARFSERLDRAHELLKKNGRCTCRRRRPMAKKDPYETLLEDFKALLERACDVKAPIESFIGFLDSIQHDLDIQRECADQDLERKKGA